ncbi:hypothetical protein BAUCODRAFT_27674 [Baudoinia panamericana UAMH 10762]|uniref:CCHC-type domain-containing protein n=1 Tax=Baudoinia panamericana (strain UAMH 10762) TaxID=717646 RepID=M2M7S5_BAUPA|nr:uncharacterized protein BAUCODRAFT_27674 [Baudoinia panamericana UAMH 10762]EMC92381.1 hypothetical protein BAUCODRAFT_27674 [Baudoinia panamericana UAMH 10762]
MSVPPTPTQRHAMEIVIEHARSRQDILDARRDHHSPEESRTSAVGRKRALALPAESASDTFTQSVKRRRVDYVLADDQGPSGDHRRDSLESGEVSSSLASSRRESNASVGDRQSDYPSPRATAINRRVTPIDDDLAVIHGSSDTQPELALADLKEVLRPAFFRIIADRIAEGELSAEAVLKEHLEVGKPFRKQAKEVWTAWEAKSKPNVSSTHGSKSEEAVGGGLSVADTDANATQTKHKTSHDYGQLARDVASRSLRSVAPDAAGNTSIAEGRRLYVSIIGFVTTKNELEGMFKAYTVESITTPVNPRTKHPTGYGFVDVATAAEAERAVKELDSTINLGRKICVQIARDSATVETAEHAFIHAASQRSTKLEPKPEPESEPESQPESVVILESEPEPEPEPKPEPELDPMRLLDLTPEDQELQHRYFHLTEPYALVRCLRCGEEGHMDDNCTGTRYVDKNRLWRTYTASTVKTIPRSQMIVSCYNCGSNSHWGDDCDDLPDSVYKLGWSGVWSAKDAAMYVFEASADREVSTQWAREAKQGSLHVLAEANSTWDRW